MTLTRRTLLASTGLGATAVAALGAPVATFVSMPDFFNGDVADLPVLPTWDGGAN